nr:DUF4007 family protein [Methylomarinum sp. Ch1-1]MDP4520850.1 DUF4007 family protein [Methylomarinum sp. Ch1-1]
MDILQKFENIRAYKEDGVTSIHKPVMLLIALSHCYKQHNRFIPFSQLDNEFRGFFFKFNLEGRYQNSHYPFGKLENDDIWEVEDSKNLSRTSVGHLHKKELFEKNISGGFAVDVYNELKLDNNKILKIIDYLLHEYISLNLHNHIKEYLKVTGEVNHVKYTRSKKTVALIGTQKFAISRWWLSKGIEIVQIKPDIFSQRNQREAMKCFIAGSAVIKAINNWMLASRITDKGKYGLTDFGMSISKNDPKLLKSSTWWGIHLSLCFSDRGEPYIQFFLKLDSLTKDWVTWKQFTERLYSSIEDAAEQSINSNLEGVKKCFRQIIL